MAYFDNIKVGDEVIDIMTGEFGKVVELGNDTIYPIVIDFGSYTIDGKWSESNKLQRLFYKGYEPTITIPEPPKRGYEFKSFKEQYSIKNNDILDNVYGDCDTDFENGQYRHTKEQAKASFERNKKANRLEMLVYDIQEEVGGKWYLYFDKECRHYYKIKQDDEIKMIGVIYMYEETAKQICKILNNGEYEL